VEVDRRCLSARERLLRAADELFYAEGVNSVGIDRIIEHAGVAKASLYSSFGSKDELIRAYLERRHQFRVARVERHMKREADPRAKMLAVFDALQGLINSPRWRGCPFLSATGEARTDAVVKEVAKASRDYTRACFVEQATALRVLDPAALADRLVLLYDGVVVAAQVQVDRTAAMTAREMAGQSVDCAPRQTTVTLAGPKRPAP
jgi:AcrR family transcriptional regulator